MAGNGLRTRAALLRNGRFRLLFLATLGSGFGNWLALIALQVDVYDRTHSGWWVGELLIADILPAVFIGLLLGPLVDRLQRKRLMIGSDLCRLLVFAALPFAHSASAIVALAAVAGIGSGFFRPAVLAGVPNLVPEAQLGAANALLQMVDWTTTAIGPLVGGALVAASGPNLAYDVNAATFAVSAALVVWIPARLLQSERSIGRGRWSDLSEGYSVVRRSKSLTCVLVVWSIVMIANGGVNVAEVFLAKVSYHSGNFGFGLLWAGSGVGLVAGGLVASSLIERDLGGVYVRFLGVYAMGALCGAAAPNVWIGAVAMALAGFGNGGAVVTNITLVQRGAPDRLRGRAFTLVMSANYAVLGLAFVAAGPVTNAIGARWVYVAAGGFVFLAAATASPGSGAPSRSSADPPRRAREGHRMRALDEAGTLAAGVRAGETRALARAISLVEDGDPAARELIRLLYPNTGRAHTIGLTGAPGVGKSTLISALVAHVRSLGSTVGVISVDPSSPFTRGALLGDRIRLAEHFLDPEVFIRSMGTRGHTGGLAETTLQAMLILDAAGKDVIFLETVGTGQNEIGVVSIVDTIVLALMPGSGDSVQALKAGIMEIPDVIAINKRDHPLASSMRTDLRQVLGLGPEEPAAIVMTEALRGDGVPELWQTIVEHRTELASDGRLEERRRRNLASEVFSVAATRARRHLENAVFDDPALLELLEQVRSRSLDPLTAVHEILGKVFHLDD